MLLLKVAPVYQSTFRAIEYDGTRTVKDLYESLRADGFIANESFIITFKGLVFPEDMAKTLEDIGVADWSTVYFYPNYEDVALPAQFAAFHILDRETIGFGGLSGPVKKTGKLNEVEWFSISGNPHTLTGISMSFKCDDGRSYLENVAVSNDTKIHMGVSKLLRLLTEQNLRNVGVRVSDPAIGVLITVVKARDLLAGDSNGFSDPYVIGSVHGGAFDDGKKVFEFKTKVINKTLNPEWNEHFVFQSDYNHSDLRLMIEDKDFVGSDHLGTVNFDFWTARRGDYPYERERIEGWHDVKQKDGSTKGSILLRFAAFGREGPEVWKH